MTHRNIRLAGGLLAVAMGVASCGNKTGEFVPMGGGSGSVIPGATKDASTDAAGLDGRDGGSSPGGSKADAGKDVAAGGHGGGVGQGAAGQDGGYGDLASGNGGGQGGASGANAGNGGSGGMEDACTACERKKCSQPQGIAMKNDQYSLALAAYSICFLGTGFPVATVDTQSCSEPDAQGPLTLNGPEQGTPKATACRALLDCVHRTHCEDIACYCGAGVSSAACSSGQVPATGVCKTEVENAVESTEIGGDSGIAAYYYNRCLANASAFELVNNCDLNCCGPECVGKPNDVDQGFCTASSGASGASGAAGKTGGAGIGGEAGASGAAGRTGSAGVTGAAGGAGGVGAVGGAGHGGETGTAGASGGVTGMAGMAGAAGMTGTAGMAGSAGMAGASGGSSLLSNANFDGNLDGWVASFVATLSRSALDTSGAPNSGSIDVRLVGADATTPIEGDASQCLAVTGGASYDVGAKVLVPEANSSSGNVGLWTYVSADCAGPIASVFETARSGAPSWQSVKGTYQVPATAKSMKVRLITYKPSGQTSADAFFDGVSLVRH